MAGLTKQHFKEIATILNNADYTRNVTDKYNNISKEMQTERHNTIYEISEALADYFKTQNPLFNKERFLKACLE
jgi:hypothetical protein